jgi:hypothetical protein
MTHTYASENTYVSTASILQSPEDRANQILNALIQQTSQQDYDEVTVNKLIDEYESLLPSMKA